MGGERGGDEDPGRLREESANSECGRAAQPVGTGVCVHRAWEDETQAAAELRCSWSVPWTEHDGSDHRKIMKDLYRTIKNLLYRQEPLKGFKKGVRGLVLCFRKNPS